MTPVLSSRPTRANDSLRVMSRLLQVTLLAPLFALAACQGPDVGQSCTIAWSPTWQTDGTPPPPRPTDLYTSGGGDYFESGNLACEGLVCIVSPAAPGSRYACDAYGCGYCSKPCVSNDDCYEKKTGLVCRQMVLDSVFIEQLDPATRDRYLSDIQFSSYCATPR
jgi:hypothetical protein